ncbi:hypothetical protein J437_LFUL005840 [Ladona fulva]|uniref:Uncharacterized protein n=1 Tax=Ladona fulva TaxID=123851 RepID=A0A8K0KFG2_LADFU|nr:hypothetical protein J437_LFUL005840 [Ladona fulva]
MRGPFSKWASSSLVVLSTVCIHCSRPCGPPPLLVLLVLVGCAYAQFRPPVPTVQKTSPPFPYIPIVRQSQDVGFDGTFTYSYETANGIVVEQSGYLKNAGQKDQEAQVMQGSYSYPGPDGKPLTVRYFADETGFHAEGDHLPVPVKA